VTAREFTGPSDLRAMQRLVQDAWALRGPNVAWHVGDLAWAHASIRGREAELRRELWEEDGRVVAYAWLSLPHHLGWMVDPRRAELLADVLDWAEQETDAHALETSALASDAAALDVLRARGYVELPDAPWFAYTVRELDDVPEPEVPDGYALRTIRGEEDVPRRAEVHRRAWAPSRVTEDSVRDTMATWPYRPDLDCVLEAPDRSFAAYTLAWYDDENRVGELEPVGTVPEDRRRGLGRAVNLFALRQLRAAGAERAIVMCRGDADYPIPKLLYESVGFRPHDRNVVFRKPR
jgi:ribosomal protein S18 acetylase RimI-like enzyme